MNRLNELELIKRAQSGDKKAKNRLCIMHTGFVQSVAAKYSIKGLEHDDIVQLCYDGLSRAIDDYDLNSNIHLISYAVYKMRGFVTRKAGELTKLKRSGTTCNIDNLYDIAVDGEFYSDDCFVMLEKCIELANISEKNKIVMREFFKSAKYDLELALNDVGGKLNLSRERVRQILKEMRSNSHFKALYRHLKETVEV